MAKGLEFHAEIFIICAVGNGGHETLWGLKVTGSHPCSKKSLWQEWQECLKEEKVRSKQEAEKFQQGCLAFHCHWNKAQTPAHLTHEALHIPSPYTDLLLPHAPLSAPSNHFGLLLCLSGFKRIPVSGPLLLLMALPKALWPLTFTRLPCFSLTV